MNICVKCQIVQNSLIKCTPLYESLVTDNDLLGQLGAGCLSFFTD